VSWPAALAWRWHHHLVQPKQGELGRAQLPAVDAAQPQEVEDDGQRYDQDAGEEEIVIVDKREARPGGVRLPDALLPEIPAGRKVVEMPRGATRVLRRRSPCWGSRSPHPLRGLLLLPSHPSLSDAASQPTVPEWQKPRLVEDGSERPLHLPVVHQLGRVQARVVQGEAEPLVKDLVHPGRFEALVPAGRAHRSISLTLSFAPRSLTPEKAPPGGPVVPPPSKAAYFSRCWSACAE